MNPLPQVPYYLLYKNDEDVQRKALYACIEKNSQQSESSKNRGNRPNDYWEEFEWTPEEKHSAAQILSRNEITSDIVQNNTKGRGEYLIQKLEKEAPNNWDKFYKSHQTKFFKDRHYLEKAFPHEFGVVYGKLGSETIFARDQGDDANCEDFTIVEIGCGVGNTVLPLLELEQIINVKSDVKGKKRISVWGLDFSNVAIDLLRQDERFIKAQTEGRARGCVWDITVTHPRDISFELEGVADVSLLLFCLSAVSPEKMIHAAEHVAATLKPGATLILRDYGRFDEAQMKLGSSRGKRLSENFYVKSDSTRVFYFATQDLENLFGSNGAGLEIIELKYIQRVYKNRSDQSQRKRVWVQGRFRKPHIKMTPL